MAAQLGDSQLIDCDLMIWGTKGTKPNNDVKFHQERIEVSEMAWWVCIVLFAVKSKQAFT